MEMRRYLNNHGDSGVVAYELGPDWIAVKFVDGKVYQYTHQSGGSERVTEMKKRAAAGQGLSTYIAQNHPGFEVVDSRENT
jgi:hypothetical protein